MVFKNNIVNNKYREGHLDFLTHSSQAKLRMSKHCNLLTYEMNINIFVSRVRKEWSMVRIVCNVYIHFKVSHKHYYKTFMHK